MVGLPYVIKIMYLAAGSSPQKYGQRLERVEVIRAYFKGAQDGVGSIWGASVMSGRGWCW